MRIYRKQAETTGFHSGYHYSFQRPKGKGYTIFKFPFTQKVVRALDIRLDLSTANIQEHVIAEMIYQIAKEHAI